MTDVTHMSHVADAIDRLMNAGTNCGEVSADFANALLADYPTVQAAVVSYLDSKITQTEFDAVVDTAIQLDGELSLPFARELDASRIAEYVKVITGFVCAYGDISPGKLSVPDAIDWFIQHDTRLQAESADTIKVVTRLVTEKVTS
jgi:hypothetical protein